VRRLGFILGGRESIAWELDCFPGLRPVSQCRHTLRYDGTFILLEEVQPKATAALRRLRIAPPIAPKPPSIIAQLAGSGTDG